LKEQLRKKKPFLIVFKVPSNVFKEIEDDHRLQSSSSDPEASFSSHIENIKLQKCGYKDNDAGTDRRKLTSHGQEKKDYNIGDQVRVYDEKSKKWLSGNVEALGADGVVYVKSKDKDGLVNVLPFEGKICRFIPDVKERMSIQISVECKELEDKLGEKVRLTFDKWTATFGWIRERLVHKSGLVGRNEIKISLNEVVLDNKTDDQLVMSILTRHNWYDGCCFVLSKKILQPDQHSKSRDFTCEPWDSSDTGGGPPDETLDSEEIAKINDL